MAKALPNWLTSKYFALLSSFGYLPFSVREARSILGNKASIILSKMLSCGWIDRMGRGSYRVVHPIVALMEASGAEWRSKVRQRDRLPVLELVVARTFEVLGSKLESIAFFGSLARGELKPYSDVDILIVARELPKRYSDRVKLIREITSCKAIDDLIIYLWKEEGVYVNFDILLIDEEEAGVTHPFYLDMTESCIMVFDRNGLLSKKIEEVKEKLKEMEAVKIEEPDGSWYWVLTPKPEAAREVEL